MTRFGYTLMTEQSGPKDLVRYAVSAENVGFDFEVSSDHYFPWLASQGHAPNAWTMLGAVAHATDRVELFTYVTCPIMRYHPAVVAQQVAPHDMLVEVLPGAQAQREAPVGEDLQGRGLLREAIEIIRELFGGELVSWK